jgi:hypothetical protein
MMVAIVATLFLFTGCKKENNDPSNLITVNVSTTGLIVKPITKSFDPLTWVYLYNPNSYELVLTGQYHTYTFSKSIQELQTGFAISVAPDTYTVTYLTGHNGFSISAPLSNELDISINESQTITNTSTSMVLAGHNEDFLIVVDIPDATNVMYEISYSVFKNFFPSNDFFYSYYNVEGQANIKYMLYVNGTNTTFNKTIPNVSKGNIYHCVLNINGGVTINIESMLYNSIGW